MCVCVCAISCKIVDERLNARPSAAVVCGAFSAALFGRETKLDGLYSLAWLAFSHMHILPHPCLNPWLI